MYNANFDYIAEAYEQLLAQDLHETKRWNKRVLVEPLVILSLIFGYCLLQGHMQQRDLKAQMDEQAKARQATCNIKQYNTVHQFDCTVTNKKLAEITP